MKSSKSSKKAPVKKEKAARPANGGSARKDKLPAHLDHADENHVDMQSVLHEIHGNPDDKKQRVEHWETVECPYCGEGFEIHIEAAEDGQTMYEDCRVCCKPISLHVQVEDEDVHIGVARA